MTVLVKVFGLVVGDDERDPISASAAEIQACASFKSSPGGAGEEEEEENAVDLLSLVVVDNDDDDVTAAAIFE